MNKFASFVRLASLTASCLVATACAAAVVSAARTGTEIGPDRPLVFHSKQIISFFSRPDYRRGEIRAVLARPSTRAALAVVSTRTGALLTSVPIPGCGTLATIYSAPGGTSDLVVCFDLNFSAVRQPFVLVSFDRATNAVIAHRTIFSVEQPEVHGDVVVARVCAEARCPQRFAFDLRTLAPRTAPTPEPETMTGPRRFPIPWAPGETLEASGRALVREDRSHRIVARYPLPAYVNVVSFDPRSRSTYAESLSPPPGPDTDYELTLVHLRLLRLDENGTLTGDFAPSEGFSGVPEVAFGDGRTVLIDQSGLTILTPDGSHVDRTIAFPHRCMSMWSEISPDGRFFSAQCQDGTDPFFEIIPLAGAIRDALVVPM